MDDLKRKLADMLRDGAELEAVHMLTVTALDKIMESKLHSINSSEEANVETVRRAMVDCINTTESIHGLICTKALICMAEADHLTRQETGNEVLREGYIRDLMEACISDFSNNLRQNVSDALDDRGIPNFMDPNRKLREELLQ